MCVKFLKATTVSAISPLGRSPSTGMFRVRCTRCPDNLWRSAYLFVTRALRALPRARVCPLSPLPSIFVSPSPVRSPPFARASSLPRPSLSVRLPKSRQHLACSILGEIQADILSRAITVTFDHRMTGEWLTLRHQSMNFSLSARYNLQSAWRRRRRRFSHRLSPCSLGTPLDNRPSFPLAASFTLPYHRRNRLCIA